MIVSKSSHIFYHIDSFCSKPNFFFFFLQYTVHKAKSNSRGENLTTIETDRDHLADKRRVVLGRSQSSKRPAHVVTFHQNHMVTFSYCLNCTFVSEALGLLLTKYLN